MGNIEAILYIFFLFGKIKTALTESMEFLSTKISTDVYK